MWKIDNIPKLIWYMYVRMYVRYSTRIVYSLFKHLLFFSHCLITKIVNSFPLDLFHCKGNGMFMYDGDCIERKKGKNEKEEEEEKHTPTNNFLFFQFAMDRSAISYDLLLPPSLTRVYELTCVWIVYKTQFNVNNLLFRDEKELFLLKDFFFSTSSIFYLCLLIFFLFFSLLLPFTPFVISFRFGVTDGRFHCLFYFWKILKAVGSTYMRRME